MKKVIPVLMAALLLVSAASALAFDAAEEITVMSREEGSGTRGAFIELLHVQQKNDAGENVDMTTVEAIISNSTSVMLTGVAGDEVAIGYVSLGSLNNTVKALAVDGVNATVEAVKAGEYKICRPFNIAVKGEASEAAQDFINFILSAEGQQVVESNGYIGAVQSAPAYAGSATGKIVVAGSSSVTPIMEKLREAYLALNSGAEIEVQQSDSTTGMRSALEGICDIGMASRGLKDSELEAGLVSTVIAIDGIAVIVNNNNPADALTSDVIRGIFTGEVLTWQEAGIE